MSEITVAAAIDVARANKARHLVRNITESWGELRRLRHLWPDDIWPIPEDALGSLEVEMKDMQREIEKHG